MNKPDFRGKPNHLAVGNLLRFPFFTSWGVRGGEKTGRRDEPRGSPQKKKKKKNSVVSKR